MSKINESKHCWAVLGTTKLITVKVIFKVAIEMFTQKRLSDFWVRRCYWNWPDIWFDRKWRMSFRKVNDSGYLPLSGYVPTEYRCIYNWTNWGSYYVSNNDLSKRFGKLSEPVDLFNLSFDKAVNTENSDTNSSSISPKLSNMSAKKSAA